MKLAIIDIPGIGPAAAKTLAEHRIGSLVDFAKASVEEVSAVPASVKHVPPGASQLPSNCLPNQA